MLRSFLPVGQGAFYLEQFNSNVDRVNVVYDCGSLTDVKIVQKALWIKNGMVANAILNEACSSGCGSFIEGTAHSLHLSPHAFNDAALTSKHPVDLGTKCTVFMSSRVKHAQKIGASVNDLAAGIAYSVVKNALFRIIGAERIDSLGPKIVVQGGAFKSDAVLRAFEKICNVEVIRP